VKRFWKEVTLDARVVTLDGRPVRTPGRVPLMLPTDTLAEAVAAEWRAVGETVDPRTMPLTGLANAAIDRIAPDTATFAAGLAAYGESDLLYYRALSPDLLIARQVEAWDPWLAWARARYDVHFETTAGIIHQPQPAATLIRLGEAVAALDAFRLAGLSPVVTITGSLILALALIEGAGDPDTLWTAANVDEDFQAEMWGVDALAAQALANKRGEFDAAVRFLHALD
jgi:chaperone required for assembly of F1-ATPase